MLLDEVCNFKASLKNECHLSSRLQEIGFPPLFWQVTKRSQRNVQQESKRSASIRVSPIPLNLADEVDEVSGKANIDGFAANPFFEA